MSGSNLLTWLKHHSFHLSRCSSKSKGGSWGGLGILQGRPKLYQACPAGQRAQDRARSRWWDSVSQLAWECLESVPEDREDWTDLLSRVLLWPTSGKAEGKRMSKQMNLHSSFYIWSQFMTSQDWLNGLNLSWCHLPVITEWHGNWKLLSTEPS